MSDSPQGPGWWQASDGKWYPPEQAPGYTPGGAPGGGGAMATGGTDIGSVFQYSWSKFSQNVGEWVVLWLITIGVVFATIIIRSIAVVGSGFGGTALLFSPVGLVLGLLFGCVIGVLHVAVAKAAVMVVNGQTLDIAAAFKLSTNNIIAGVVFGAAFGLLSAFCGFFGILAYILLGFLPALSALDDKGADAISEAMNLSTGSTGENLPWMAISWFIGGYCFLGAPIAWIGAIYLLKKGRGEPVAA